MRKAPLDALLAELAPEFGAAKVFRPYRDVRFSKDKTPYKTHAAAVVEEDGSLYVQLGADGLFVGGGYWHTQSDQVQRLRAAVDDDLSGRQLQAVLDGLAGWEVMGERLKRIPKPYSPDHPRADLLLHKSLAAGLRLEPDEWLHTAECVERGSPPPGGRCSRRAACPAAARGPHARWSDPTGAACPAAPTRGPTTSLRADKPDRACPAAPTPSGPTPLRADKPDRPGARARPRSATGSRPWGRARARRSSGRRPARPGSPRPR